MHPNVGKWQFRVVMIALPLCVPLINELQRQLAGKELDIWTLSSFAIGVVGSTIAAAFNVQRAATEHAESTAEVVTGVDQDADKTVEQTEGQVGAQP